MGPITALKLRLVRLGSSALTQVGAHEWANACGREGWALLDKQIKAGMGEIKELLTELSKELDGVRKSEIIARVLGLFEKVKAALRVKHQMVEQVKLLLEEQLERAPLEKAGDAGKRFGGMAEAVALAKAEMTKFDVEVEHFLLRMKQYVSLEQPLLGIAEGRG